MPYVAPDILVQSAIPPFVAHVFAQGHMLRKLNSTAFQGPNRPLQHRPVYRLHRLQVRFKLSNQPASAIGDDREAVGDEVHDPLQFSRQG